MQVVGRVTFGQFSLDTANERLCEGSHVIPLRPKVFAVLRHLVEHRGELVTKQQLLDAVWPSTFVGDAVLKDSVRQLRDALHDDAGSPRYIETAHRRGYRFIGITAEEKTTEPALVTDILTSSPALDSVFGRDNELTTMRDCLARALRGERQVLFVTGEAGIGKTTVVNTLLASAAAVHGIRIARGQCLEQYGAGEAYLPLLDGLSRLGRELGGGRIIELLRQYAPAWLRELPSLIPAGEREALQQQVLGTTRERMLREMAEMVEALTAETPLILVLEDLHWSDYSTLDLVAFLARRRDPARLLLVGTYRPVEVILSEHPLKGIKRELQAHGLCHELPLQYLTEEATAQYLAVRFPNHQFPGRLVRLIHRRTEGNPLFMVNVTQHLVDESLVAEHEGGWQLRGALETVESAVPESVKQLIEKQIERLGPEERRALEGASVVGMECSSVAIAAGLGEQTAWVEEQCEALVRRHHFLMPARLVELPDGTITPRYRFSHVLYLDVPYSLIAAMQRSQIHGRVGDRGEAIYGSRVGEIAAELAMHFEQARDPHRAVQYLLLAAENAMQRSAQHEAEALARRGLLALEALPDTPERAGQELDLRLILGMSLMATKGFAVAEVASVYRRALALCADDGPSTAGFMIEWFLGLFHYFRGELRPAHEIATRLLDLATDLRDPLSIIEAHRALGVCLVDLGKFDDAVAHLDQVSLLYETHRDRARASFAGQDPKVVSDCFAARALWALGHPDKALQRVEQALTLAQEVAQPQSLVIAEHFTAHIHQLRGNASATLERAETVIALADEYCLDMWAALGHVNHGWALSEQGYQDEGLREMRRGLDAYEATGGKLWRAHFLGLLAEALAGAGRAEEGLATVTEGLALANATGEMCSTAELHRIHGDLLLMPSRGRITQAAKQAEAAFDRALAVAQEQCAKSWETKVAMSRDRCSRAR